MVFFSLWQDPSICLFALFYLVNDRLERQNTSNGKFFLFLLITTRPFFLSVIAWSVIKIDYSFCMYDLSAWLKFIFYFPQTITFLNQLCPDLNFFLASLLQLVIIWLTVSSLLPNNLFTLFHAVYVNWKWEKTGSFSNEEITVIIHFYSLARMQWINVSS